MSIIDVIARGYTGAPISSFIEGRRETRAAERHAEGIATSKQNRQMQIRQDRRAETRLEDQLKTSRQARSIAGSTEGRAQDLHPYNIGKSKEHIWSSEQARRLASQRETLNTLLIDTAKENHELSKLAKKTEFEYVVASNIEKKNDLRAESLMDMSNQVHDQEGWENILNKWKMSDTTTATMNGAEFEAHLQEMGLSNQYSPEAHLNFMNTRINDIAFKREKELLRLKNSYDEQIARLKKGSNPYKAQTLIMKLRQDMSAAVGMGDYQTARMLHERLQQVMTDYGQKAWKETENQSLDALQAAGIDVEATLADYENTDFELDQDSIHAGLREHSKKLKEYREAANREYNTPEDMARAKAWMHANYTLEEHDPIGPSEEVIRLTPRPKLDRDRILFESDPGSIGVMGDDALNELAKSLNTLGY
jgi:hypothetical protein